MSTSTGKDDSGGLPNLDFAPKDLTDGRAPGDWRSRYEALAWRWILVEGLYLLVVFVGLVVVLVIVWLRRPADWWHLSPRQSLTLTRYAYAWLAGTLGGLLFAMKWLYHAVAKWNWNLDRSLWRYLTPHISGGLAFATVVIFNSIMASEQGAMMSGTKSLAMGFLVGFFSDNAIAKLAEVAETLLAPARKFPTRRHEGAEHGDRSKG